MPDSSRKTAEKGREIYDPLFESCADWSCVKCGGPSRGSEYHKCEQFNRITQTLCEYCCHFQNGRCFLKK